MVNNFVNKYIHFCLARTESTNEKLDRVLKYSTCVDKGFLEMRKETFAQTIQFSSYYEVDDFVLYETRIHGQTSSDTSDSGIDTPGPSKEIKR